MTHPAASLASRLLHLLRPAALPASAPKKPSRFALRGGLVVLAGLVSATGAWAQLTVAGALDVSPGGSATYSVPIKLPPGIGGVQPSLSLVHSSQGSGSQLGSGFGVAGLSVISRCPRTPAQDGSRGPLAFDTTDRYCMDGQRLILVAGTEGLSGAEYRTEIDSFSKITVSTVAGVNGGPAYFIVKTKSGLTLEYGNTTDSRVFGKLAANGATDSVVSTWALDKVSDTLGNYMTYTYVNDTANGQYYISQIDYTGNAAKSLTPTSRVNFAYTTVTGSSRYQAGRVITNTVQLTSITVNQYLPLKYPSPAGYYPVTQYTLAQAGSDTVDKSTSVTECGYPQYSGAQVCKPPLTITSPAPGNPGFTNPGITTSTNWGTADNTWVGDFNGDGIADIASANGGNVYMRFGQANNNFTEATWSAPGVTWGGTGYSWVGDFNGDGLADIATTSGGNVYVLLSTGTNFTVGTWATGTTWASKDLSWIGDFDGDGRTDLATLIGTNMYVWLSTGSGFTSQTWTLPGGYNICAGARGWAGDFDGDGVTDITVEQSACSVYGLTTFISKQNQFATSAWLLAPYPFADPFSSALTNNAAFIGYTKNVWVGDVNGDGLADLFGVGVYGNGTGLYIGLYVHLSTGSGLSPLSTTASSPFFTTTASAPRIGDFNGDGLLDVLQVTADGTGVLLYAADGKGGFSNPQTIGTSGTWGDATFLRAGDFNGDGRADLVSPNGASLNAQLNTYNTASLTQTYKNGLGADVQVVHKPMSQAMVSGEYSRTGWPIYPNIALISAMPLVTEVKASDAVQGTRSSTHTYSNYIGQAASGRGSPIFNISSATDSLGFTTTTIFRFPFPYRGAAYMTTRSKGGTTISRTTNTYSCLHPDTLQPCVVAPGKRYFVYTSQSQTDSVRDIDANGNPSAALPGSLTVNSGIDAYGNVGSIVTTTLNPDGSPSGFSKTVTNTYYNDFTNWILGRLLSTTVQSTAP